MTLPILLNSPSESSATPPPHVPSSDAQEQTLLAGKRVVIVEDEGITQLHLRKILTRAGLIVAGYALNGRDGVATVLREQPDLVLMDINMPGEINGLEAARQIISVFSTCVVMITAYSDHKEEAQQLGASGYAIKPVESMTLFAELERAMKRFQQQS